MPPCTVISDHSMILELLPIGAVSIETQLQLLQHNVAMVANTATTKQNLATELACRRRAQVIIKNILKLIVCWGQCSDRLIHERRHKNMLKCQRVSRAQVIGYRTSGCLPGVTTAHARQRAASGLQAAFSKIPCYSCWLFLYWKRFLFWRYNVVHSRLFS